jgi:thiol-disulfide isomerase/thioredoxin
MKKIWKPVIIIGLIIFLGINLYLDLREPAPVVASEISAIPIGINKGELAPNFEGITLDGESITLADLRGKTVLINVFASWCGPCQLEAPHLTNVYAELGGDEVVFIGLNLEEKPEDVAAFKEKFGWKFPLVLNEDGAITDKIFTPIGLPTSWFIDPQGVIQYVHAGPITEEMFRQAIVDIQAGREPSSVGIVD